ncbi:MAG: hypothetical protein E7605_03860 [Ruminococcaceae bacterium]|nr:hypothetical protein [Oscillospiraceae bacterium]
MKNTNFERIEYTQGDTRTEKVVVHTKKHRSRWRLKLLSVVLAFLIWLIVANVTEHRASKDDSADSSCCGEITIEHI